MADCIEEWDQLKFAPITDHELNELAVRIAWSPLHLVPGLVRKAAKDLFVNQRILALKTFRQYLEYMHMLTHEAAGLKDLRELQLMAYGWQIVEYRAMDVPRVQLSDENLFTSLHSETDEKYVQANQEVQRLMSDKNDYRKPKPKKKMPANQGPESGTDSAYGQTT